MTGIWDRELKENSQGKGLYKNDGMLRGGEGSLKKWFSEIFALQGGRGVKKRDQGWQNLGGVSCLLFINCYICCILRTWLQKKKKSYPSGFENNHLSKLSCWHMTRMLEYIWTNFSMYRCSLNFQLIMTYVVMLENCQNNISNYCKKKKTKRGRPRW